MPAGAATPKPPRFACRRSDSQWTPSWSTVRSKRVTIRRPSLDWRPVQVADFGLTDLNGSAPRPGAAFLAALLLIGPISIGYSQEPARPSLAGPQVAAARRETALRLDRPFVQLGPATWSLGAGIGLQASDNIRLESENARSDLAAHPEVHARMLCPISANNVLNLKLRTGYSAYLQNPGFNHFYIGPETVLGFEIYAGDFRVEVHDRCSLLENNYEDPTVVGSGGYTRLENGAGVGALWDLNQVLLSAGYDHINYISYAGGDGTTSLFPDSASETVTASVGGRLRSECFAGVEASGTLFHYAQSGRAFSDARQATSGPFLEAQISEYLFGRAGAGYSVYSPEDGTASIVSNNDGWYAHMDLTHKASRLLDYTLSAG